MKKLLMVVAAVAAVLGSAVSAVAADFYRFTGETGGEGAAAAMRGVNYPGLRTFSACAWVRNVKAPPEKYAVILSQGALGNCDGFCLYLSSSGVLSFQTRHSVTPKGLTASIPSLLADDGVWHLVGVTHDWEKKVKRIWVDGEVCAEETVSASLPDPSTDAYAFCLGARHGKSNSGVGIDYPLTGDMTEASLWNVVLTADDFAKLLTARVDSAATGLIGYWPLDDKCGSCTDKSADGHDLNPVGNPGMWDGDASVVYQQGIPDALNIAKGSYGLTTKHQYNLSTFSACAWIKNPPTPTSDERYGVIMSQGGIGDKAGWTVYIAESSEKLMFQTRNDTKSDNLGISKDVIQDGLWHSIIVTHDWDNKIKRLYVDGTKVAEQTDTSLIYNPKPTTATRYFAIGTRHSGSSTYQYPGAGSYAHVSLWDKALTEEEVQALHAQVPVGNEPNLVGYWPLNDGVTGPFADLAGSYDATILGSAAGYSMDPVPFYEQYAKLFIDGVGISGFDLRVQAVGQTGEASAKVVWGPETAPRLHTNDLGSVTLPDFSAKISHGLLPQATYQAQVLVTTTDGAIRSPIVRFAAPSSSVLGSAYQRLPYIESTGTQMIDTKCLPNATTCVQMSLELSPTMDRTSGGKVAFMFGCVEGTATFQCNFGGKASEDNDLYCWLDKTSSAGADTKKLTITTDIRTNRNEFCVDASSGRVSWGTKSATAAIKTTVHGSSTIGIFGRNNNGTPAPFTYAHMRLYACKIYDNGQLVRNFVPCRELAGEKRAGLYDLKGGEFYPNAAGTDDFLAESDVDVLYPLTIASCGRNMRGPVDPDYGTLYMPAGADIPFAALADVDPENPKAKFRGWETFKADDKGGWELTGAGQEKSVLFAMPTAPAKFSWDWGRMGLILFFK